MKKIGLTFVALLLISSPVFSGSERPAPPKEHVPGSGAPQPTPDCAKQIGTHTTIENFFFGLSYPMTLGGYRYVPSKNIPFTIGQEYGWRVTIHTNKTPLNYVERYELPQSVTSWGGVQPQHISADKRVATIPAQTRYSRTTLEGFWTVSQADHPGNNVITVLIEGEKACEFRFTLDARK